MNLKIRKILGNIKYSIEICLSYIYYIFIHKKNKYKILDDYYAIDLIINNRKSVARFGDGEIKWMLGVKQDSFQDNNQELSKRLEEIIKEKNANLLIGIPRPLNSLKNTTHKVKKVWKFFIFKYESIYDKYIDREEEYIDTNITRFYMDYKDKSDCKQKIKNIKRIWDNRDVIIIEGDKVKLGVGNDLLENTNSIERIIAPNRNAFNVYDKILNIAKIQKKEKLFLISLGPTATILASDLSKLGYQAIDIGHIDIEYEWLLMNAKDKVPIKGKYVNEAKNKGDLSNINIDDEKYKKSIIKVVK